MNNEFHKLGRHATQVPSENRSYLSIELSNVWCSNKDILSVWLSKPAKRFALESVKFD